MSIFEEYGGRNSYLTSNEQDRLENPEKYNYDQASYDAFAARLQKKSDSRAAADAASRDAIRFGYVGRGTGSTVPAFSFGGYSGQTSGGTSGIAGMSGLAGIFGSGETIETIGGNQDGPERGPGGGGPGHSEGDDVERRSEGGHISYPVQQMEAGGVISSPYANPMKPQMGTSVLPAQQGQPMSEIIAEHRQGSSPMGGMGGMGGIGGIFQNMQQHFGQQMTQLQSSPLKVYGNYLNQTYTGPAQQNMQAKVTEFVDLVDQAERAHFGAEESFGYGKQDGSAQPLFGGGGMMYNSGPDSIGNSSSGMAVEATDGGIASLPSAF